MATHFVKKNILGIELTDATRNSILEYVVGQVEDGKQKLFIVTPNPEMIVASQTQPHLQRLINEADIALCDGVGLHLAGQLLHKPLPERITGVDFMKSLCEKAAEKAYTIGFLGGRGSVAERTSECLKKRYPLLKVEFVGEEFDVKRFPKQGVDILFVAFGFPKQEEWIAKHLDVLPIKVAMGVGGAFDYLSGNVARAPFLLRSLGLEWLFRLIRQPWRWRRQLSLLTFMKLVIIESRKK